MSLEYLVLVGSRSPDMSDADDRDPYNSIRGKISGNKSR